MAAPKGGGRRRRRRQRAKPVPPEEARRESRLVDFKASMDVDSTGAWCELVKDIVTMANSGGGAIVFGVDDHGKLSDADLTSLLALDSAKVVDKIGPYTDIQFADFDIRPGQRNGKVVAVMEVQGVFPPMVFVRAGTYDATLADGMKKQRMAFNVGTVYFRHGAKSEPASSHDLKQVYDRQLAADRRAFLADLQVVAKKPRGTKLQVVPGDLAKPGDSNAISVRLTDRLDAPMVRALDPDRTHPYRQKELLAELNKQLEGQVKVSSYQVQCVRKAHGIDEKVVYSHQPKFATRQYSEGFLDWMVDQYNKDPGFFIKAHLIGAK